MYAVRYPVVWWWCISYPLNLYVVFLFYVIVCWVFWRKFYNLFFNIYIVNLRLCGYVERYREEDLCIQLEFFESFYDFYYGSWSFCVVFDNYKVFFSTNLSYFTLLWWLKHVLLVNLEKLQKCRLWFDHKILVCVMEIVTVYSVNHSLCKSLKV